MILVNNVQDILCTRCFAKGLFCSRVVSYGQFMSYGHGMKLLNCISWSSYANIKVYIMILENNVQGMLCTRCYLYMS